MNDIYEFLKRGARLDAEKCSSIIKGAYTLHQLCSLAVLLSRCENKLVPCEIELLHWIFARSPMVAALLINKYSLKIGVPVVNMISWLQLVFNETHKSGYIGKKYLTEFVSNFVDGFLKEEIMAAWLMIVCVEGLSNDDTIVLTSVMMDSGKIYDYRQESALLKYKLLRRYPTGGLSEKAALILPSLLACAAPHYGIVSPFLVARSLSFTGGTWDKLSAIQGFKFPAPGEETIRCLLDCGVAMTVTHEDINPADRLMYQLRSVTGTVESHPLILSSIASKQLCVPVHCLLMDVRFGSGAFLKSREEAFSLAGELGRLITKGGVPTISYLTDTEQPGGASIGNALEVAEAIAVLGGGGHELWDVRWLLEQRTIVIDFFAKLMASVRPDRAVRDWSRMAATWLSDGSALKGFLAILRSHGVTDDRAAALVKNPMDALSIGENIQPVFSCSDGNLRRINQRKLGSLVNFSLGAGGNTYSSELCTSNGIVMLKRLGDPVRQGEEICRIFTASRLDTALTEEIRKCFVIDA